MKNFLYVLTFAFSLFVFSFAPVSYNTQGVTVQKAHATIVEDLLTEAFSLETWIENILMYAEDIVQSGYQAVIQAATASLELKEFTLDGIAWALVNTLLQQMIQGITDWVSSGFQGTPAFITDFKGYLMNVGDVVAQDFIEGTPLETLCTPFRLNIQVALSIQYAKTTRYAQRNKQCTISGIVGNVENFINGDFLQGGWDGWFQMTLNPQNNIYGSMLEAETAFKASIGSERDKEINLLSFGQGLFSTKDENGNVITPGKTVETGLNHALGLPGDRLALADEIDELIAALLGQLVQTVMGAGVANLNANGGGGGGGGGNTYWDDIANQQAQQGGAGAGTLFTRYDSVWSTYIGVQNSIIGLIDAAEDYQQNAYPGCAEAGTISFASLDGQRTTAQGNITSMQTIIDTINNYETTYPTLGAAEQATLLTDYNAYISQVNPDSYTRYNATWSTTGPGTPMSALQIEIARFEDAISAVCNPLYVAPNPPIGTYGY